MSCANIPKVEFESDLDENVSDGGQDEIEMGEPSQDHNKICRLTANENERVLTLKADPDENEFVQNEIEIYETDSQDAEPNVYRCDGIKVDETETERATLYGGDLDEPRQDNLEYVEYELNQIKDEPNTETEQVIEIEDYFDAAELTGEIKKEPGAVVVYYIEEMDEHFSTVRKRIGVEKATEILKRSFDTSVDSSNDCNSFITKSTAVSTSPSKKFCKYTVVNDVGTKLQEVDLQSMNNSQNATISIEDYHGVIQDSADEEVQMDVETCTEFYIIDEENNKKRVQLTIEQVELLRQGGDIDVTQIEADESVANVSTSEPGGSSTVTRLARHLAKSYTSSTTGNDKSAQRHMCSRCGLTYPSLVALRQHMALHTQPACLTCGLKFHSSILLREHMRVKHGALFPRMSSFVKPFACKYCHKRYPYGESLRRHYLGKHKDRYTLDVNNGVTDLIKRQSDNQCDLDLTTVEIKTTKNKAEQSKSKKKTVKTIPDVNKYGFIRRRKHIVHEPHFEENQRVYATNNPAIDTNNPDFESSNTVFDENNPRIVENAEDEEIIGLDNGFEENLNQNEDEEQILETVETECEVMIDELEHQDGLVMHDLSDSCAEFMSGVDGHVVEVVCQDDVIIEEKQVDMDSIPIIESNIEIIDQSAETSDTNDDSVCNAENATDISNRRETEMASETDHIENDEIVEVYDHTNNVNMCMEDEDSVIATSKKFTTWSEFADAFEQYLLRKHSPIFIISSTKSVECYNKTLKVPIPKEVGYYATSFECVHAGHYNSRSKGLRPKQITLKIGCPAMINIVYKQQTQCYEITKFEPCHMGHEVNEIKFKSYCQTKDIRSMDYLIPRLAIKLEKGVEVYRFSRLKEKSALARRDVALLSARDAPSLQIKQHLINEYGVRVSDTKYLLTVKAKVKKQAKT